MVKKLKYKISISFSVMLFLSAFTTHICAQALIRPGYGEFKMINSQSTFTGNVVFEGLTNPEEYINKKFKVVFINFEKQKIIPKTYISREFKGRESDEFYYEIDAPDLIISPYSKKDKQITGNYFNFLVLDNDFYVEKIILFDKDEKISNTEIKNIEKIFSAEFMEDFPNNIYEGSLRHDVSLISVRFSTPDWLLVDSYILRKGVDYGYGYYVPNHHSETNGNKNLGQYLYNRKTGDVILLKKVHLIGDNPPVMIIGKNITYLSSYIKVGKTYGYDEILGLENNKVKIVFTGSTTGS